MVIRKSADLRSVIIALVSFGLPLLGGLVSVAEANDENPEDVLPTILVDAAYTGEIRQVARGGLSKGSRYLDNFDLMVTIDGKAFGAKNGTLFLYGLYNNNTTFSDTLAGDAQVVSNIDTEKHFRLEEAWYEHRFLENTASLKMGLIDLNSEFDAKNIGALFLNSSHGIGPDFSQTGENGPSIFPATSMAVRADWAFNDNYLVRVGVFDAVPQDPTNQRRMKLSWNEGTLVVAELERNSESGVRFAIGGWHYTSRFDAILPGSNGKVAGNNGLYSFIEAPLYEEPGGGERGLDAFVRIGFANAKINQFGSFWSAGFNYRGLFPGRTDDLLGLAFAYAANGSDFKESTRLAGGVARSAETNIELTYRAQLADWIVVQPDIQYIINPGGTGALKNALVLGLRFEVGASF
jgi:porin